MAYFTAYVQTNNVGSRIERTFEIDDDEFEGLNESERDELIDSYAQDAIANDYDWGWKE